jgi:carbohydrate-binding DOMON domain-containing protein
LEKEIRAAGDQAPAPSVVFDESGSFLLYPTMLGVKAVNLATNAVPRLLGKVENTERFLQLALYQGVPRKVSAFFFVVPVFVYCLCNDSHNTGTKTKTKTKAKTKTTTKTKTKMKPTHSPRRARRAPRSRCRSARLY